MDELLIKMIEMDASDIYLMVGAPAGFRINGAAKRLGTPILTQEDMESLSNSVMTEKQREEFASSLEMNLSLTRPGVGRFRVNIYRQRGSVGMVVRQITTEIPTLEDLGSPEIFKDICMSGMGLVLMVGATGSGKSTSLAAMIDHRNGNQEGHIITIEDPVEFMHSHKKCYVTQREVGSDTLSFKDALKNSLRQAPDVILLGEIRDREVMEHAISFAETGHLAMATLHANNANQAIDRIINFFPEEHHPQIYMNLALNLRAIVAQRLVKTADGSRTPAIEILINSPRVSDLILNGNIDEIKGVMAQGEQYGMETFDGSLFKLWESGTISEVEALRNADSANNLRLKIKTAQKESDSSAHDSGLKAGDLELSI